MNLRPGAFLGPYRIDAELGRFQGRIRRDDWVGQAKLLAEGKSAEFSDKYGAGV